MPRQQGSHISMPRCLYLEVTNRCNLKCRTCLQFSGMREEERDLSFREVKEIVDQVPGLQRAVLHGIGEPLLNRELTDIIKYLKSKKARVLFNSNALLLNRRWAEKLVSSGLDELRVSLDAATESTYRRVRNTDNFAKVVKNIEVLARLRTSNHRSRPRVSLWIVATRDNVGDLPDMIRLAPRLDIDEVYLQRLVYPMDGPGQGLAVRDQAITNPSSRVREILRQCGALSRKYNVQLKASGLVSPEESLQSTPRDEAPWRQCRRPWEVAYITAQGNVLPCCISPFSTLDYPSLILGNVFEQPLKKIWYGEKFRHFRQKHKSVNPHNCCSGCGVGWSL